MDAELEFAIQPNTTGKQLFDQVKMATGPGTASWKLLEQWWCYLMPLGGPLLAVAHWYMLLQPPQG